MKAMAFSVWVFINLAFLGMGGYMYLVLSSYWCREHRPELTNPLLHQNMKFVKENQIVFYTPDASLNTDQKPQLKGMKLLKNFYEKEIFRKTNASRRERSLEDCFGSRPNCKDSAKIKVDIFKNKLFLQLRRVLHQESNVFKTDNPYFVNYSGPRERYQKLTSNDIKCRLRNANLRLLTKNDIPISGLKFFNDSEEIFLNGKHYKSCAIVSSAGSLLHSKLGRLIDQHEVVVRFNHAPTKLYEEDVGAKTTIRLVNSQVVSKDEFHFITNPLFKKVTLVVWDPSNYTTTLQQWYEKPDFNFFESWSKQKLLHSKHNSFIIDPRSIWRVWDFLQSLTSLRIRKNPPSSGFLGLVLLMPYCDYIDFFEYVPSLRLTKKCHYFEDVEDDSCTFGVWHPLSAEKMLSLAINEVNDTMVFETGFIRVKGFKELKC